MAERGVESLFGGSECAGRSLKRTLQPRQIHNGSAEPLMSRRRPCSSRWISEWRGGTVRGMDDGTYTQSGSEQERPVLAALSGKDRSHMPVVKASGVKRESDGVIVLLISVQHNALGGKGPDFGYAGIAGTRKGMVAHRCDPITPLHVGAA